MPKLMIVDDDATMVSLLRILLEMDGFEVINAYNRETVLSALRDEQPNLVLMDVFLTDNDGLEILSEIRATSDVAHVPVIMTSGMDLAEKCMKAGANAFLLKPYNPEQLAKMIQANLDQS